jgi:hypothetical protein
MSINKFTTLLDLSRQAKIITGETATFDGKIEVGIPFSGYPTGVDTGTTVSLGIVSTQSAVLSGNTGTTLFNVSSVSSPNYNPIFSGNSGTTWTNPLFSTYTSGLTLPITPVSADTQIVGTIWTLTQTGYTGDYVIDTQYTGFNITYSFNNIVQIGTGNTYSGVTTATQENFSAGTLDYKGPLDYLQSVEDATIDGRLHTNKITIRNGASAPTIGYVLTQTGSNGEGEWLPNSSADTNTYVTGGTLSGTSLLLNWNTGGSANPINISSLSGGTFSVFIVSGTTGLPRFVMSIPNYLTNPTAGGSIGMRSWDDVSHSVYGKVGDMHVYASIEANGLNIINSVGTGTEDYIRFYAGQTATGFADIHIQGSGATRGYVGFGTETPDSLVTVNGKTKTQTLQITSGATNGYVLTSDGSGNATWSTTISATTIGSSGDCVDDIYVTNLRSCSSLNINSLDEGSVYFGSTSGITVDVINKRIGVNTTNPSVELDIKGNTFLSGSSTNILSVIGSGSSTTDPIIGISGSSGELFTIKDTLVGSLFSVNDISGLPTLEVLDNNTVLMGSYSAPAMYTTVKFQPITGLTNLYSIDMNGYTGAWFDYTVVNSTTVGAKSGQIMAIFSGNTVNYVETTTSSIGSTSAITLSLSANSVDCVLQASATTLGWEVKTIIRSI